MAPPLQAIVLAASSILMIVVSCSAQLAELPSPSTTTVFSAPLHLASSAGLYSMEFSVGDTIVSGVIDTGSDLIWTSNPNSFYYLMARHCDGLSEFSKWYGSDTSKEGVRGAEGKAKFALEGEGTTRDLIVGSALTFDCPKTEPKFALESCKAKERGGIVGLGRGKLSLVSQLELHSFSYCLPDHSSAFFKKATGQIKFNDTADPLKDRKGIRLVRSDEEYPASSRYYVELMGIMLGTEPVKEFPKACTKEEVRRNDDEGMMIIDSGSASSWLPAEVFEAIKKHVEETTKAQPELEDKQGNTCYYTKESPSKMDKMVLTFCGGSQMEIPYLVENGDKICLTIKPQEKPLLLGAYQQQGMHMLFNITGNTLSFAKSACGQSQEENHAAI